MADAKGYLFCPEKRVPTDDLLSERETNPKRTSVYRPRRIEAMSENPPCEISHGEDDLFLRTCSMWGIFFMLLDV